MLHYWEVDDLLGVIFDVDSGDYVAIEDALYERWGTDHETFMDILDTVLNYVPSMQLPLSEKNAHSLIVKDDKGYRIIVKKVVT